MQILFSILRFLTYLPIHFVGRLLAYPLVPLAVSFADEQGRLPWGFQWLETHDALGWVGPATEEATIKTTERWGRKAGLIHYLWRNKAYTLRNHMRVPRGRFTQRSYGPVVPSYRWGLSYWAGTLKDAQGRLWWELQPRLHLGGIYLYIRMGWKLHAVFLGPEKVYGSATGIFTGITPRSDDLDDFI